MRMLILVSLTNTIHHRDDFVFIQILAPQPILDAMQVEVTPSDLTLNDLPDYIHVLVAMASLLWMIM